MREWKKKEKRQKQAAKDVDDRWPRLVKSEEQMEDGREGEGRRQRRRGEKAEKYVAEENVRKECCAYKWTDT